MNPAAFIGENTAVTAPSLVPEIRLHLATEALPLWGKTEEELAEAGLPPPFWAFAWAGGQALARHILDHRDEFVGRRVLDLGAGSGIAGIAAAKAGAMVTANEVDRFAIGAIGLNAAQNGVSIKTVEGDLLDGTPSHDVVLVGDLFYERALAERALRFLRRGVGAGAQILVSDPNRSYLPVSALTPVCTYTVPTPRALEDADVRRTTVYRFG